MERRKIPDRRKVHMFVFEEQRTGPHDRRGAENRRLERAREMEKIKRIQAFKEQDRASATPAEPILTKKQLAYIGLALLLLAIALFGI
jgi:hypothetical protein